MRRLPGPLHFLLLTQAPQVVLHVIQLEPEQPSEHVWEKHQSLQGSASQLPHAYRSFPLHWLPDVHWSVQQSESWTSAAPSQSSSRELLQLSVWLPGWIVAAHVLQSQTPVVPPSVQVWVPALQTPGKLVVQDWVAFGVHF